MNPDERIMKGKICLITGATSGIGRATARTLAGMGATVIVAGRNREKTAATVDWIKTETGNPSVEALLADLTVQAQVHRMAERFNERHRQLDLLINNAGGFFYKRRETADGIEMTFALNQLAPFLLVHLLLDALRRAAPARIVNVSSRAHRCARTGTGDLEGNRRYSGWRAYRQSKLAVLQFTYELARRLKGSEITANAVHPGFVATGIGSNTRGPTRAVLKAVQRVIAVSPEKGAQALVHLAASPDVETVTGRYFADRRSVASSPVSYDREMARVLWEISARMTHLPVTFL